MSLLSSLIAFTGINPELVFACEDLNSSKMDRGTIEKFPKSQHRPSLITTAKNLAQSQVSRISVGTFARPTGNYTASLQTSYRRNYHRQTLALLIRHTRTSVIPSLQQQSCQLPAVAK